MVNTRSSFGKSKRHLLQIATKRQQIDFELSVRLK